MKKMLICCGALCMTLLLFCGTALAKVDVQQDDPNVTVTPETDEQGLKLTVSKSGVEAGQLYLVMVQGGSEKDPPDENNLYYLDVTTAGTTYKETVRPKEMANGTYTVFLSDYAANNGGRKAVATLTVSADSDEPGTDDPGDSNTGTGTGGDVTVKYGDVNGDGDVTGKDRIILSRYLAKWTEYGLDKTDVNYKVILVNADLNSDGQLTGKDRIILSRNLAKWPDYQTLPMPES